MKNDHFDKRKDGRVRKAFASQGDDATLTRFIKTPTEGKPKRRQLVIPGIGHPTIEAGRSLFFRKGVRHPEDVGNVLVSGHNNAKIGRDIRKGAFRGYWIYTLTLEERATCPRSCTHWYDCYGNGMPYAKRIEHAPELLAAIACDIQRLLLVRNRRGIMVRLHALGDFYSIEYVAFWCRMLDQHERLAIYGYTARQPGTAIGDAIASAKLRYDRRFAIRYSDGYGETWNTVSVASASEGINRGAIPCPEQTGLTQCCATCALCWGTDRTIAFTDH